MVRIDRGARVDDFKGIRFGSDYEAMRQAWMASLSEQHCRELAGEYAKGFISLETEDAFEEAQRRGMTIKGASRVLKAALQVDPQSPRNRHPNDEAISASQAITPRLEAVPAIPNELIDHASLDEQVA